jgi:hypothetical protein
MYAKAPSGEIAIATGKSLTPEAMGLRGVKVDSGTGTTSAGAFELLVT